MKITGEVKDDREALGFTIEPFTAGGFLLSIRFGRDGRGIVSGAGVWPSIEKAKAVAEERAAKLSRGATVDWYEEGG
jgi:hypothetical protein